MWDSRVHFMPCLYSVRKQNYLDNALLALPALSAAALSGRFSFVATWHGIVLCHYSRVGDYGFTYFLAVTAEGLVLERVGWLNNFFSSLFADLHVVFLSCFGMLSSAVPCFFLLCFALLCLFYAGFRTL